MLKKINYTGYAAGTLGTTLVTAVITTYLTIYLTNVALMDIAAVAAIMAVSKVFDGISDIIIGNIVDHTSSRFGRARVWILRMCIPLAAAMMLLFWMPPQLSGAARYVYVFIMYNLVNTVFLTFMNVSDMSLISLMTPDRKEHGLLANAQSFGRNLGVLLGSSFTVKLLEAFSDKPGDQNTQKGYTLTVAVICLFMVAANIFKVFTTKETEQGGAAPEDREKRSIKKDLEVFRTVLTDKNWVALLLVQILNCICMPLAAMGAAYFAMYRLGDMGQMSWMMATQTAPSFLVVFFIPMLMKKYDKVRLLKIGAVVTLAGAVCFGLALPARGAMIVFNLIRGTGQGIFICMLFGLVADSADIIGRKRGAAVAGVCFAGMSAGDKIGTGLGSALFGAAMAAAGFSGALKVQPPAVATASTWMFVWAQAVIFFVILIILTFMLDKDMEHSVDSGDLTTPQADGK